MKDLTRRQVARTAAWSVPVLAIGVAAPAASASSTDQSCPGVLAGPAPSWLTSSGFSSDLGGAGDPVWYVEVALNFQNDRCGFGSNYDVTTSVSDVVVHTEQSGHTGTLSPLASTNLNSFANRGQCEDTLTMAFNSLGVADLYVTTINFVYLIGGLADQGDTPCTVPVTATVTYPGGAAGNDAKGTVAIS